MQQSSVEEPGRALRQRQFAPYRPRPALTSSDRGKANAELRRQRELEANLVFAEANETISNVKHAASSSVEGEAGAQDDEAMESEVNGTQVSLNASPRLGNEGQSSSQADASGVVSLAEAVPVLSSTQQQISPPSAKKARIEDDFDFDDDDDGFFEQLVATDAIDWDSGSSKTSTVMTRTTVTTADNEQDTSEQGYDLVRKLREKHPETNGFRWSSEKQVKVAPKSLERAMKVISEIKKEVDREGMPIGPDESPRVLFHVPRPGPGRAALAPLANTTLNRQLGTARTPSNMQTVQEGKRKLQEEGDSSQTPLPPIRPSSSLLSTPDRRLPLVRPTGSPISQTPNPARSALRLGTTLRGSTPRQSTPSSSTPSRVNPSIPRTPRISLGMTPRRAVSASVPKFKTPFKDSSIRQETPGGSQRSPDLFKIPAVNRGVSSPCVMGGPGVQRPHASQMRPSIFNLDQKEAKRYCLRSMGFEPESTSVDDVRVGLSSELYDTIKQILRQPNRSLKYAFAVKGHFIGREGVHTMLTQELGAEEEIQKAWIDNHYILILWKLAAYTRHLLDESYWNWEEVCRQFKYRYEREFHRKNKSAVKRILREDSSPARPMVLCVFEIPPFDEAKGEEQTIVLTDGWYKIKAVVDKVLCLAIYGIKFTGKDAKQTGSAAPRKDTAGKRNQKAAFTAASATKGRQHVDEVEEEEGDDSYVCPAYEMEPDSIHVKVGVKLAIQGASLESHSGCADPLRAYEDARLRLGGNSTKMAVWDAKLGFTRGSFIQTIRSLSAEGGKVPLMDIVITRLFPIAFTGSDICPGYEDDGSGFLAEWNEEEEKVRRDAWEKHREKAIAEIEEEQSEDTQVLRRICEQLDQAYEGLTQDNFVDDAIDASSCQEMLYAIIVAGSASGYLSMVHLVPKLRELAYKKLQETCERLQGEVESNLHSRLGSRNVRSFRYVRFRDATPEDHGRLGTVSSKREQCQRGALMRIWDYAERKEAECDMPLSEGDHFMVNNLIPSRTASWRKVDVYSDIDLTSTKMSTWRLVNRVAKVDSK